MTSSSSSAFVFDATEPVYACRSRGFISWEFMNDSFKLQNDELGKQKIVGNFENLGGLEEYEDESNRMREFQIRLFLS